jgi:D-aspartate ligase
MMKNLQKIVVGALDLAPTLRVVAPPKDSGALVIGGDYRGLGIVRSLGRHRIPVWVLTDDHLMAATSRYCRHSMAWPDASDEEQLAYLLDLADRYGLDGWAIFPTGDEAAAMVARNHAQLSQRFLLTTPSWEVMRWAYDKRLTYRMATELGVDCPRTYYPRDRDDVAAFDCPFPLILKPAIRVRRNPFTNAKAWRVESREELLARYDEACQMVDPEVIMLQELIPGAGESQFSFAALCNDGIPLASITARRTRQFPVDFGLSSSYVETLDLPEVEKVSLLLLAALRYQGLAEVEFKRDPRDGRYKLLDINPRVWGWHTLGRKAGADFPYLQWQLVHGEPVAAVRARPGIRWVRAATDLPAVVQEIRRNHLSLRAYLSSLLGPIEYAILAPDDPLPAVLEVPLASYMLWRRRRA